MSCVTTLPSDEHQGTSGASAYQSSGSGRRLAWRGLEPLRGRFQANSERMRTGDIMAVAEVLKSLTVLSEVKPLSYRERKMLDRARFLLISELSEASSKTAEKVEQQIDDAMASSLVGMKGKLEH